jgi:hypothetical protein
MIMTYRGMAIWFAPLAMLATAPVAAQSNATPCEIHVWPAERMNSATSGWVFNNVQDADFKSNGGSAFSHQSPLDHAGQVAVMAQLDLGQLLGLPGATVVSHEEPTPPRSPTANEQSASRKVSGPAPCYAELEVTKLFYGRAPLAGRSLQILFTYRLFNSEPTPQRVFSTFANEPLLNFPAKDAAHAAEADAELLAAFRQGVIDFAGYATRVKGKRRTDAAASRER